MVAEYLELLKRQGKVLLYAHIPQETYTTSWAVKVKNTKMGVRRGVPDYLIVTPTKVLFLELKRKKGGVVSLEQLEWLDKLNAKTTSTGVAKGFDEAQAWIDEHSKNKRSTWNDQIIHS